MRNRTYGGVRGRKTKVGETLLRFPPTRLFPIILSFANLFLAAKMQKCFHIAKNNNAFFAYLITKCRRKQQKDSVRHCKELEDAKRLGAEEEQQKFANMSWLERIQKK